MPENFSDPLQVFRNAKAAQKAVNALGAGAPPRNYEDIAKLYARSERMSLRVAEMIDILMEHESQESDSVDVRLPEGSWLEVKHALRNILEDREIRT